MSSFATVRLKVILRMLDRCAPGAAIVFDPDRLPEVAAGTPTLADESKAVMRVPDER